MRQWKAFLLSDDTEPMRLWAYGLTQRGVAATVLDFTRERPEDYLKEPPDLITFDVHRALAGALCVCRQLRAELVSPVLMMAYFSDEPQMVEAHETAVDECIAKPTGSRLALVKVQAWRPRAWTMPIEAMSAW